MTPNSNTRTIAFIGFGEVGQRFARDLVQHEELRLVAYDVLFADDSGQQLLAKAKEIGVDPVKSASAAISGADLVFSAVTASQAEKVAKTASRHLKSGQFFLDVNSASPNTKRRAARYVTDKGAAYIECAVMAPVLKPGLAVPILTGGPHAAEAAVLLNGLGMKMTPVATEYGRASAMKLCRSIMIKGLEALMVDCAAACETWDVKEPVFASLAETFPSINWYDLSENMRERVASHGVRRSAEMREAGDMLADMGLSPALSYAVADAQLRGAGKKAS